MRKSVGVTESINTVKTAVLSLFLNVLKLTLSDVESVPSMDGFPLIIYILLNLQFIFCLFRANLMGFA